ncbi:MAG: amidohydrolase family protein [Novosphingobium sp.]
MSSSSVSTEALSFRVFDGDNHYYETYDSFTRFMEPSHMDCAIHVRRNEKGRNIVFVGDTPLKSNPAHPQDFVAPPGAMAEIFSSTDPHDSLTEFNIRHKMRAEDEPSFVNLEARLSFMDEDGIDAAMLYPSLGVMVEQQLADDVEATYANLRAFNRWLEEDWGYNTRDRIFSVPMLSLLDLDMALEELDRVLKLGARAIHIRTGPAAGRSPADEYFDPFWARLNEAHVPVALHSSWSQYHKLWSSQWSEKADPTYRELTSFQSYLGMGARPMMDTLAAMVFQGLFNRFPNINVLAVEGGSYWVGELMRHMDKAHRSGKGSKLSPRLPDWPSKVLQQHLYVTPFHEEDVVELAEKLPVDHIILGSDYPHAEGLSHPRSYAEKVAPLGPEAVKAVMGENLARVIGIWGMGRH